MGNNYASTLLSNIDQEQIFQVGFDFAQHPPRESLSFFCNFQVGFTRSWLFRRMIMPQENGRRTVLKGYGPVLFVLIMINELLYYI